MLGFLGNCLFGTEARSGIVMRIASSIARDCLSELIGFLFWGSLVYVVYQLRVKRINK